MAGLLPAAKGQVLLDGEELKPALQQRKREELQKVQFVFQMADTALNPRPSVLIIFWADRWSFISV